MKLCTRLFYTVLAAALLFGCSNKSGPLDKEEVKERIMAAKQLTIGIERLKIDSLQVIEVYDKNFDPIRVECEGVNMESMVSLAQIMDRAAFALTLVSGEVSSPISLGSQGPRTAELDNENVWFSIFYTNKDGRNQWTVQGICYER